VLHKPLTIKGIFKYVAEINFYNFAFYSISKKKIFYMLKLFGYMWLLSSKTSKEDFLKN